MNKILDLIKDNDIKSILDIGANVGNFSSAVKQVFPHIDILMIEANKFCESFLERTQIPYKLACLSDTEREIEFYVENRNFIGTGASYYVENTEHYSEKNHFKVQTKLLDNIVDRSYDLVKLDTQGSELDIMKGGVKTINSAKFVIIETSLIEYNKGAPLKDKIFEYMKSIGFFPKEFVEEHYADSILIQEDWVFAR